jgi:hypothetical protein
VRNTVDSFLKKCNQLLKMSSDHAVVGMASMSRLIANKSICLSVFTIIIVACAVSVPTIGRWDNTREFIFQIIITNTRPKQLRCATDMSKPYITTKTYRRCATPIHSF